VVVRLRKGPRFPGRTGLYTAFISSIASMGDLTENTNKKRSLEETSALQLLELAGRSPKLPRLTAVSRRSSGQGASLPPVRGQFEDASNDGIETIVPPLKGSPPQKKIPCASSTNRDLSVDGQFEDASEPEIPNLPGFGEALPTKVSNAHLSVLRCRRLPRSLFTATTVLETALDTSPATLFDYGAQTLAVPASPGMILISGKALVPLAPKPSAVRMPTAAAHRSRSKVMNLAEGPIRAHPNPILMPDSGLDSSMRLRPGTLVVSDLEFRQAPIQQPLPIDILLGRGSKINQHTGNTGFRDVVQAYRTGYHRLHKGDKMQLAQNLVNYVRQCGGRFLKKAAKDDTVWYECGDDQACKKCSQALRETITEPGADTKAPGTKPAPKNPPPPARSHTKKTTTRTAGGPVDAPTSQTRRSVLGNYRTDEEGATLTV
jgi:hypothetical protein